MSALPPEVTPEPDRERAASRSTWRVLLAVLVSVSLLSIVISQIDLDDALLRLRNAELTWICASFLMIALVMVFRGIRFWLVTQISRSGVVIAAVFLQNFFNRVMPFRLGELSLPYLLKKAEGEPVAPTVISLVLIRLMELWIVLVMAAVALWVHLGGQTQDTEQLLVVGSLVSPCSLATNGFARFSMRSGSLRAPFKTIAKSPVDHGTVESNITERHDCPGVGTGHLLMTILVVISNQVAFDFLLRALGYELSFLHIMGVGNPDSGCCSSVNRGECWDCEAGWVVGFMLVGMARADAMLTGVVRCSVYS